MSEEKYTLKQYAATQGEHTIGNERNGSEINQYIGEASMYQTRQKVSKQGAKALTDHSSVSIRKL